MFDGKLIPDMNGKNEHPLLNIPSKDVNFKAIDHISVAVEDLDASVEWYRSALGFAVIKRVEAAGERSSMKSAILRAGAVTVVLVQPSSSESQVAQFLEAYGPGVHHVAFAVDNLEAAITAAENGGATLDTPIVSGEGVRQVFLGRDEKTGIRIELIESGNDSYSDANISSLYKALEKNGSY